MYRVLFYITVENQESFNKRDWGTLIIFKNYSEPFDDMKGALWYEKQLLEKGFSTIIQKKNEAFNEWMDI